MVWIQSAILPNLPILQKGEKCGFMYAWADYYVLPNSVGRHYALHSSGTLFVGSYLQITLWALGQWRGKQICIEWKLRLVMHVISQGKTGQPGWKNWIIKNTAFYK